MAPSIIASLSDMDIIFLKVSVTKPISSYDSPLSISINFYIKASIYIDYFKCMCLDKTENVSNAVLDNS